MLVKTIIELDLLMTAFLRYCKQEITKRNRTCFLDQNVTSLNEQILNGPPFSFILGKADFVP